MRVLLDCRMGNWSGVGRYVRALARALGRSNQVELIQMIAQGDSAPSDQAESVEASERVLSIAGAREFARVVKRVQPDVTHCAQYPVPFPAQSPLVVTLHDLTPILVQGSMEPAARRWIYTRLNRRALRVADRVICVSRYTASDLERVLGADPEQLRVVHHAADDFSEGPCAALPNEVRRPYLLSFGNTKPHKDIPTLLRAFDSFAASHPEHHLVLVGDDKPGYFETCGVSEAVRQRCSFTGRLDDSVLRTLYSECEIFVLPSRYEGFGLPVLEAMALGAPVVCAHATSLPEVAGDAALYFEPGDDAHLAELISGLDADPDARAALARAGEEHAGHFTWDLAAQRTIDVYREVAP